MGTMHFYNNELLNTMWQDLHNFVNIRNFPFYTKVYEKGKPFILKIFFIFYTKLNLKSLFLHNLYFMSIKYNFSKDVCTIDLVLNIMTFWLIYSTAFFS